jgi:hypothetical protein
MNGERERERERESLVNMHSNYKLLLKQRSRFSHLIVLNFQQKTFTSKKSCSKYVCVLSLKEKLNKKLSKLFKERDKG